MRAFVKHSIFLLLLVCFSGISAQEPIVKDSVYHKMEHFSKDKKFFQFFHKLIFRKIPDTVRNEGKKVHQEGEKHQEKVIRNIYIESISPFGNSSSSDKTKKSKWYEDLGNKIHIKSKNFTIRGYLLFKKGDKINPQTLYESERLLRNMHFINRAKISVIDSSATQDSADVLVRVLDSWSLRPMLSYSNGRVGGDIVESNFLGLGHEISMVYRHDFKDNTQYRFANYSAQNIYGTFINAKISGEKDFHNNENVYIKIHRNFVSPLTRWAGGIDFEYYKKRLQIPTSAQPKDFPWATIKVHHQDFWGGYQFRLKEKNTESISENIGIATRFQNFSYLDAPNREIDPHRYFGSYHLLLGSVGYSQRKFKVEKYVFRHNLPEDIPYGKNITVTGGVAKLYGTNIPYAGVSASYGFFNNIGYFNIKNDFGSFFRRGKNYRTTFRLDATYFSPLTDWGSVNVRHFFSPTLVVGNLRSASYVDRIHLSSPYDFPAYSDNYLGKDKLILRYQLQFFVKKAWKNFYYNPYFITTLGWLSREDKGLFQSTMHTKFGIGVHIFNPFLSFNRFQISFVFYPKVPFGNQSIFDFNSYKNHYFPIQNFALKKPTIADYGNNFSD